MKRWDSGTRMVIRPAAAIAALNSSMAARASATRAFGFDDQFGLPNGFLCRS